MLPHFIIAGTFPAGTGHLYSLLVQHPGVFLPRPMQPECNFFYKTGEYEKGLDYYQEKWFSGVTDETAIGERSSLLLSGTWTAARVHRDLPDVKLIFLLRNPVDRAYANYRFTALAGYEDLSFEEALDREDERVAAAATGSWREIQPHAYFRKGLYAAQLREYATRFPPERQRILRSDSLLRDMPATMRGLFAFLGLEPGFVPEPVSDFSSPTVIDLALQRRLREQTPIGFDWAVQRLREGQPPRSELDEQVRGNVRDGHDPLPDALRRRLTERYREANEALRAMVSFPIDDWL